MGSGASSKDNILSTAQDIPVFLRPKIVSKYTVRHWIKILTIIRD
jgi:hypothetical protein